MIIREGKSYRSREGNVFRNARHTIPYNISSNKHGRWTLDGPAGPMEFNGDGSPWGYMPTSFDPFALVDELPDDTHAVETVEGVQTVEIPEWVKVVESEANEDESVAAEGIGPGDDPTVDIKATIADEAKRIVSGARRSAYGKPEANFERIARFWQAYFENTGRGAVGITAADVSPLMRLMKEARLAESPAHYDSFVDLIGYTLTGAEVNHVTKPA